MTDDSPWRIPIDLQPKAEDYAYDLDTALGAVVGIRATIPEDAFTAETLGVERAGHGVFIRRNGLVLTIGYLVTEADAVWLHLGDGRAVPGDVLAYDAETGFGLVQALARLDVPALPLGESAAARLGDPVVMAAAGGRAGAVASWIVGKQEFAGYWEYALDEALFTGPAHPNWGGAALIGAAGELLGIGSLQLRQEGDDGEEQINMSVPIDLLKPVFDDLMTYGRPNRPPRPWLGLYAVEVDDNVTIAGLASRGPAARAKLRAGDTVLAVGGQKIGSLGHLYRSIWSLGPAGVGVPMTVFRDGRTLELEVASADRSRLLKHPSLH